MSRTPKPTFSLELLFQKGFFPFAGIVRLVRLLLANSTALAFRVFDPCLQLLQNKLTKWAFFLRGWPHLKSTCFKLPLEYCLLKMRVNGADLGQTWNLRIFQVSVGAGSQSCHRFLLLSLNPGRCRVWGAAEEPGRVPRLCCSTGEVTLLCHHCSSGLSEVLPTTQQPFPFSPAHPQSPAEIGIESRKFQLRKSRSKPFPPSEQMKCSSLESIQSRAAVTFWNSQDISEFFITFPLQS